MILYESDGSRDASRSRQYYHFYLPATETGKARLRSEAAPYLLCGWQLELNAAAFNFNRRFSGGSSSSTNREVFAVCVCLCAIPCCSFHP